MKLPGSMVVFDHTSFWDSKYVNGRDCMIQSALEQGLVVLVHEDGDAVSGLLVSSSDDACKAQ